MFMNGLFKKLLGDPQARTVKRLRKRVAEVNVHADKYKKMSDATLKEQTDALKKRLKKESLGEASPAFASSPVLPMFKPKARAQSATPVGQYAIQLSFSDGHSTGIYSYEHLRTICPCAECTAQRKSSS